MSSFHVNRGVPSRLEFLGHLGKNHYRLLSILLMAYPNRLYLWTDEVLQMTAILDKKGANGFFRTCLDRQQLCQKHVGAARRHLSNAPKELPLGLALPHSSPLTDAHLLAR